MCFVLGVVREGEEGRKEGGQEEKEGGGREPRKKTTGKEERLYGRKKGKEGKEGRKGGRVR